MTPSSAGSCHKEYFHLHHCSALCYLYDKLSEAITFCTSLLTQQSNSFQLGGQILFNISKNIITDLNCICCNFLTSILISNGLTPLSSLDQGASIFHKNYGLLNQPLSDLLWIKPKRSTIDKILLAWHIAPMINICVFLDLIHVVSNKHFESLLIASNLW